VAEKTQKDSNRLIHEKSPYLLQHADNPVDWHPWTEEAFEKARREDKPIFLSIGYSTCHWCHVMEHESFEDPEVARRMNETFVNIKVDREERPDIDGIYMTVCQMMTGGGGWPLTILMTPDKKPFFAGTYFPKESRYGRIGMMDLVGRIQEVWKTHRQDVLSDAEKITAALRHSVGEEPGEALGRETLETAFKQLGSRYDDRLGGFGSAPKFPTPHNLLFLLRHWHRTGDASALRMVEQTLGAMRRGGIYDHVGFGFHRYSTDAEWLVPHFEKMLYDQALLAMAYTEAYQATRKETYRQTAKEILTYVLRDMTSPEGGFYSAEDADSEGEEGRFYLWTESQLRQILDGEADLVLEAYTVTGEGNFREEASGQLTGENILHLNKSLSQLAQLQELPEEALRSRLDEARAKLFEAREQRIHPHKDDKILTDWNGLMIAALAKAARAFDEPQYAQAARKAAEFILARLRTPEGRLLHRYREGDAGLAASADDYAFLIWGLLDLYETTFEAKFFREALSLNEDFIHHYWDEESGAFYFTSDDGEALLVRKKEIYDGAAPSGNSVAALNLIRLGRLISNAEFERMASRIGSAFSDGVARAPSAFTFLLLSVDFGVGPSFEVVVSGERDSDDTRAMLRALRSVFAPNKIVLLHPGEPESSEIVQLAPFVKAQVPVGGTATAYVCQNYTCNLPTNDVNVMLEQLQVKGRARQSSAE